MQESAAREAAGEAERSVLHRCARSKVAGAVEVQVRMFELPSLEEHTRTVAKQAQTSSTTTDDVSHRDGRAMRSSSASAASRSGAGSIAR